MLYSNLVHVYVSSWNILISTIKSWIIILSITPFSEILQLL